MESHTARSEDDFAKFVVDKYDEVVKQSARDINFQNGVLRTNKALFLNATKIALKIAKLDTKGDRAPKVIESMMGSGLVAYWTGAQLAPTIPPPSSVTVVSNTVIFPGIPLKITVENTSDPKLLAKRLSSAFRIHLLTIKGVTVALVPQPSGPPIPVPFAFAGIN
jgi:hypothetical protein